MKSIFEISATELSILLEGKKISHAYSVGDYGYVFIGIRMKSQFYWVKFFNAENPGAIDAETYSQNTGKTSRGFATRKKVYDRFEKLIN